MRGKIGLGKQEELGVDSSSMLRERSGGGERVVDDGEGRMRLD